MMASYRQRVFDALPGTYSDLIERAHASRGTVYLHIKQMRGDGLVHIGSWRRTEGKGGSYQPVFVVGQGKDAPCRFERLGRKVYDDRWKKRLKAAGKLDDYMDRKGARDRAIINVKRAQAGKMVDPLVQALFGRVK